jgi:hypothetical protein
MSITIETEDGIHTYTNNTISANGDKYVNTEKFVVKNNNKTANTQGYLIKVQKGNDRIESKVQLADLESNITANLYPMLGYADDVNVTFERTVPFRNTNLLKMQLVDIKIMNEWPTQGAGNADVLEVELMFVEVIPV